MNRHRCRWSVASGLAIAALLTLIASGGTWAEGERTASDHDVPVTAVDSVGMTVSNINRAVDFYTSVLSFEKVSDVEVSGRDYELLSGIFGARMRVVRLRLGTESIELTEFLTPKGRPVPQDMRPNDRAFQHIAIIVSDMGKAYTRLRQAGVEHASTGPQTLPEWNRNAAGISAFYFRDPDRHFLEILHFPPGKGLDRWHRADRLFLGIDHTAIVVDDTDRTLRFYRDGLRMKVVGGSELRHRAGASQQRVRRAAAHYHPSCSRGARRGTARVPGPARWTAGTARYASQRHGALADHVADKCARPHFRPAPAARVFAGISGDGHSAGAGPRL
jgi:catechol 2,3-dioxygenase-like lactoylglutathione lyase family enzyme